MDEVGTPMRKIQQLVSIWKEKNTLMNQPPFWENKQTGMVPFAGYLRLEREHNCNILQQMTPGNRQPIQFAKVKLSPTPEEPHPSRR
jgi:hypothetical protein